MTRYLLIPSTIDSDCSSDSALLLPTDRFNGKTIEIEIPNGILQRFDAAEHSPNKKDIYNLLARLAKCDIGRNKDGLLTHESKVLDINFDDFLCDLCVNKFSKYYESIYCILRKNGIIF